MRTCGRTMTDVMTPKERSRCMAAIRGKDTKPEMIVRRYLFSRASTIVAAERRGAYAKPAEAPAAAAESAPGYGGADE